MPTVVTINGFEVRIHTNDHGPSHVHVVKAGAKCKITLEGADGEPTLVTVTKNMKRADVQEALSIVSRHKRSLLEKWREIYGQE
jgi:hypothetical protein